MLVIGEKKEMIRHMCMNIEGAIRNAKELKGCITIGGYTLNTVTEIREWLKQQKAKGWRVLPLANCKGFDFQTGCCGHETQEECDEHEAISKIASAICEEESTCEHWCGVYTECNAYKEAKKIYKDRKGK